MIYLDYNATTPVSAATVDAMLPFLTGNFGNPSSAHAAGAQSRQAVEEARVAVAHLLGARQPREIVFTSGGTESDNWAIEGGLKAVPDKRHIVTTTVEHEAVRKVCGGLEKQGYRVTWLGVDQNGAVDLDELKNCVSGDTAVVSMMLANNETGVIFPVAEAAAIVKEHSDALFHVDAVNAAGKVPIDLKSTEIDLLSISAHKFYGPKGIGALFIRDGVTLPSSMIGGGQESGRRAGTQAVHQIVGMGAAAAAAVDLSGMEKVRELRDRLESALLRDVPNSRLNGPAGKDLRSPNTSNISFENTNGEMIMHRLDEAGICVSTGSACHTQDHSASSVLQAMDVPFSYAMGSIRFSLGRGTTNAEIDAVIEALPEIVRALRNAAGN